MPDATNPDVVWALNDIAARAAAVKRRCDYYDGQHASVLPPAQTLSPLLQQLIEDLSDNMCDEVVDEPVARLEVIGWSDAADADADTDAEGTSSRGALAAALWDANLGDTRAPRTHRDAWKAGDGYNIVEEGPDGVWRWFPQDPRTMAVRYSQDRPEWIELSARLWLPAGSKGWRLNLYYSPEGDTPGRLERYRSKGSGALGAAPSAKSFERMPDTAGEDGVVDTGERASWYRNPVFHFPADDVGTYGRSALTSVIPLQDLLNKSIADLVVNMEDRALAQRWATGLQVEYNPDGTEKPLRRRAKSSADMVAVANKDVQFGEFDAADPTPMLAVIMGWRVEIARKGYLPVFSVDPTAAGGASGLSLLVQEGRQVKRCKAGQSAFGREWREMMAFMLTLSGVPTEADELSIEWASVTTRDEVALWELLTLKESLGVPVRTLLIEGGYDPEQVAGWLEDAATMEGGRVSQPGPMAALAPGEVASVTMPGVSGGVAVTPAPMGPAGSLKPALG